MDKRRIRLDTGLELAVLEAVPSVAGGGGGGDRRLMLVHGFTNAKEDFADHVDALAGRGWHVVAPDLRGHGESDKPAGREAYGLRVFASDLIGLADSLGWDHFTLLGHSMGGMAVQHVAVDFTHRLDALILMDTSHSVLEGPDPELVALGKQVVADGGMAALIEAERDLPGPLDTAAHQRTAATRPGYTAMGQHNKQRCSPDMWLALIDEMLVTQPDRLAELAALRLPVLIIVGEQDESFMPHAQRMAGAIAGSHLAVIADGGHSPQFESPDSWFDAVASFLDRVPTAAGSESVGPRR